MPRVKADRQVVHERQLAERIRDERERRGWSLERLAQRMTDAGCPMDRSAIHRIEQGDPPRRITVDEAVTFAGVFSTTLQAMLLPTEVARSQEATRLWKRFLSLESRTTELARQQSAVLHDLLKVVDAGFESQVAEAAEQLRLKYDAEQLEFLWQVLRRPDLLSEVRFVEDVDEGILAEWPDSED